MRLRANVDANQPAVVAALRQVGATVQHLHKLGSGCPDLLVGYMGRNFLFEVKDGAKSPSRQKLTADEQEWHTAWRGFVAVVNSPEQAVRIVTAKPLFAPIRDRGGEA